MAHEFGWGEVKRFRFGRDLNLLWRNSLLRRSVVGALRKLGLLLGHSGHIFQLLQQLLQVYGAQDSM